VVAKAVVGGGELFGVSYISEFGVSVIVVGDSIGMVEV
jgi:hypothetical protein